MKQKRRTVRCPECSSTKTVPIWYGGILPGYLQDPYIYKNIEKGDFYHAPIKFDEHGEAVLNDRIRHCNECGHNY